MYLLIVDWNCMSGGAYAKDHFTSCFLLYSVMFVLFIPEMKEGSEYWSPLFTGCVAEDSDNSCFLTLISTSPASPFCWFSEMVTLTGVGSHISGVPASSVEPWDSESENERLVQIKWSFLSNIILSARQVFVKSSGLVAAIWILLEFGVLPYFPGFGYKQCQILL